MDENDHPANLALTRRSLLRRAAGTGGALLMPGALAGQALAAPAAGGTLTWGLSAAIPNLDIAKDLTTTCTTATALCLETLVQFDDSFNLQPLLASSWAKKDPLTYVYTVRKGVKFWDGTPLTADDVAFSLGRHLDPKLASQLGSYYGSVKSIKVGAPGHRRGQAEDAGSLVAVHPRRRLDHPEGLRPEAGQGVRRAGFEDQRDGNRAVHASRATRPARASPCTATRPTGVPHRRSTRSS